MSSLPPVPSDDLREAARRLRVETSLARILDLLPSRGLAAPAHRVAPPPAEAPAALGAPA